MLTTGTYNAARAVWVKWCARGVQTSVEVQPPVGKQYSSKAGREAVLTRSGIKSAGQEEDPWQAKSSPRSYRKPWAQQPSASCGRLNAAAPPLPLAPDIPFCSIPPSLSGSAAAWCSSAQKAAGSMAGRFWFRFLRSGAVYGRPET